MTQLIRETATKPKTTYGLFIGVLFYFQPLNIIIAQLNKKSIKTFYSKINTLPEKNLLTKQKNSL
jgi:hypothetical protein